jgi:sulfur carrier protein ThiS
MRVRLRNPDREVELAGRRTVRGVLAELDVDPVLVIRSGELVTRHDPVSDRDAVDIHGGVR